MLAVGYIDILKFFYQTWFAIDPILSNNDNYHLCLITFISFYKMVGGLLQITILLICSHMSSLGMQHKSVQC